MIYSLLVLLLGAIAVNKDYRPHSEGTEIFVSSNQKHTYFILPVKSKYIDFSEIFTFSDFINVDSSFTHLSFGWGDRAYYTEAESWDDLNVRLALQAAFIPTKAAMHVDYYYQAPLPGRYHIPLTLPDEQYKQLISYILESFKWNGNSPILIEGVHRYKTDSFYEATGSYHLFFTSNNWTNEGLKLIGARTPVWSPLEEPIMKHLIKVTASDR